MIDRPSLVRDFAPIRKINSALFYLRRHKWRFHPRFRDDPTISIDRPVFLLGVQGGGLTILSRILHRHPDSVSATGDYRAWASDDECQNVYADILPPELSWHANNIGPYVVADYARLRHNWLFANDAYLSFYIGDRADATVAMSESFRSVIRRVLRLHGATSAKPKRFIDKSQSLSVRITLIAELLRDCDPRFVAFVRNPYAAIWRAATADEVIIQLDLPIEARFDIALQHWRNLYTRIVDANLPILRIWKFEDFLIDPERVVREICDHIALDFRPEMMPGPNDDIPWGSMYDAFNLKKWYPFRSDVNDRYLADIPNWARERVATECSDLIARFGY